MPLARATIQPTLLQAGCSELYQLVSIVLKYLDVDNSLLILMSYNTSGFS